MRRQVAAVSFELSEFTLSPDQKGIETIVVVTEQFGNKFTLSPDQKGIETP